MDRGLAIRSLAAIRIGIGAGAWLAPRVSGRLFGLKPAENAQAPYLARLFGIRDLALGYGSLSASGEAQRTWLMAGAVCDGADALAGVAAARGGYLSPLSAILVTATALGALGLGVQALSAAPAEDLSAG